MIIVSMSLNLIIIRPPSIEGYDNNSIGVCALPFVNVTGFH